MQYDVSPRKLVTYLGKRKPKSVDDIANSLGCVRSQVVRTLHYGKTAGCLVQEGDMWVVRKTVSPKRLLKFVETEPKTIRAAAIKSVGSRRPNQNNWSTKELGIFADNTEDSISNNGQFNYGRKKSNEWNDEIARNLSGKLEEQRKRIDEGLF